MFRFVVYYVKIGVQGQTKVVLCLNLSSLELARPISSKLVSGLAVDHGDDIFQN